MNIARFAKAAVASTSLALLVSGCSWTGLNSVSLPFTKGGDDDSVRITVELANAANLVPNSEVKYDEVTIGSVRKIELKDWTATLTVGLEKDARVPADVTAKVAQKSLLGAEYLALEDSVRPAGTAAPGPLESGAVIGLDRTSRYPETEEVLSAASLLLNGAGLPQLRTISHELNAALGGRTDDVKSFMHTVSSFTSRLDGQRDNIAATLTQLDRLSRSVVKDREKVGHALTALPKGFRLIEKERAQLVRTLRAIDGFGKVAHRVVGKTKVAFQENLNNLAHVTKQLAMHGKTLAASADALGYPFNVRAANRAAHGDYLNLITEITVSSANLTRDWLGGTPLDGLFTGFMAGTPTGPAAQATNPLSGDPLSGLLGGLGGNLLGGDKKPATSEAPATDPESGTPPSLLQSLLGGR